MSDSLQPTGLQPSRLLCLWDSPGKNTGVSCHALLQVCKYMFISVQSLSHVPLFATPWTAACQASQSITNLEFTQTHVHWVSDAIQPSHPLSSPSSPDFNLPQNQGLFQWVSSAHQVAKVLELQLQHQSFQWIIRTDFLYGLISLQSKGLSRVSSNTTVQKHQFFGAQLSLWSNSHIHTWLLEKP